MATIYADGPHPTQNGVTVTAKGNVVAVTVFTGRWVSPLRFTPANGRLLAAAILEACGEKLEGRVRDGG